MFKYTPPPPPHSDNFILLILSEMGGVISRGLSGGERKRANIVCEMMNNADIIIADVSLIIAYPFIRVQCCFYER